MVVFQILKKFIPKSIKRYFKRIFFNFNNSIPYFFLKDTNNGGKIWHIVFICKGNICRSPFAEYYLKSLCSNGNKRIESCGIDVDQGLVSPKEAILVGRKFGVDIEGHCSKGLAACELQNADLILPMEYGQYLQLISMFPECKGKIFLLRDFAPWPDRLMCNIYDPFGLGEDEFHRCFKKMQKALDGLQNYISDAEKN